MNYFGEKSNIRPEQRCTWYYGSRAQRETEGPESPGVKNYKLTGCYECDGLKECRYNIPFSELEKIVNK